MRTYDVAIIGAGTAGLSARREVEKKTDNYVVIDDGPLGTTCARIGCMPSKVLIEAANIFHSRTHYATIGVGGGAELTIDHETLMKHVRSLRDRFVRGVTGGMESWQNTHLLRGRATFIDANTLQIGAQKIGVKSVIVATGSTPIVPGPWRELGDRLLTSDQFFELEQLPKRVAVIGLGVIGLELGQALSRIGVDVVGITIGKGLAGLTDPGLQDYVVQSFRREFPIFLEGVEDIVRTEKGLSIVLPDRRLEVDAAFATMGRAPNIKGLGLEKTGAPLDAKGMPRYDSGTFRIEGTNIFFVGDVNGDRPILHEAADEGRIAGYNAMRPEPQCFRRRTNLGITFSDPNIATVGLSFAALQASGKDFIVGEVSYEGQGRAITKLKERGLLHVYADRHSGHLLGAELFAPSGEHLAHLIAWAIAAKMTVFEILSLPFYHPVVEEGLRTALRDAAGKLELEQPVLEVLRCQDAPVGVFAREG